MILDSAEQGLVGVITGAMPYYLDHVRQKISDDSVPAVCQLRFFPLFFLGFLLPKVHTASYQETASTKIAGAYHALNYITIGVQKVI